MFQNISSALVTAVNNPALRRKLERAVDTKCDARRCKFLALKGTAEAALQHAIKTQTHNMDAMQTAYWTAEAAVDYAPDHPSRNDAKQLVGAIAFHIRAMEIPHDPEPAD